MKGISSLALRVSSVFAFMFSVGAVSALDSDLKQCSRALRTTAGLRTLAEIPHLRIMSYNVENFFTPVKPSLLAEVGRALRGEKNKPRWKQQGVADMILEQDPDIVVLQEMGSKAMLDQFNANYLNGKYRTLLIPGNDRRGINIAFLVKADLDLDVELESHKEQMWSDPIEGDEKRIFSRDFPAILIREPGQEQPVLVVFGKHAKSKRGRTGDDESFQWRSAQMEAAAQIVQDYQTRFGEHVPIIISGDFNTEIDSGAEMDPLWALNFKDSFDLVDPPLTDEERVTHTYHPRKNVNRASQLDAILLSPSLLRGVGAARVVRYKDSKGKEKDVPRSRKERDSNPSDHMPIVVDILTKELKQSAHWFLIRDLRVA